MLRLLPDKPSLTVTAYIFNKFVHPTEDRYITPREAACLQDFSDSYVFVGNLGQVQQQIGNAVPVRLAKAIAESVASFLESRGYRCEIPIASYFSGAGGFDLGFESVTGNIKFVTKFTTDIDRACGATIQFNKPQWNFHLGDIRECSPELALKTIGQRPIVTIGGPPCQTFSVAGKQKGTIDPLGKLYRDYLKHIQHLNPEIVVLENVYGLAQVKSSNALEEIYKAFAEIGYGVKHQTLLAADYGTPQLRKRLIFVAVRGENTFEFPLPQYVTEPDLFDRPLYRGAGNSFAHLPPPTFFDRDSDETIDIESVTLPTAI
ncbi:DNA-cytosine methyltransferase [Geitlerinema sp. FC II]|nr:DNA-cytosine methyltransferase [Geitlerinema sp. FC II]